MLSERYRELLTAYVDGVLSGRQRRHALRLLRRSPEARRLLQLLQSDSDALIHLPRVHPDRDLSGPVLQKIAAGRPLPFRPARRIAAPRAFPVWVGAAAAAAVLFVVASASYLFFSSLDHRAAPPVAHSNPNQTADVPKGTPPIDGPPAPQQGPNSKPNPAPVTPRTDDVANQKPSTPNSPTSPGSAPPPEKEEPIFTSPFMEAFPDLKAVLPGTDVPSTFKLHDLDEKKLAAALPKNALHVELPTVNANRAFERLQGVLKAHHVDLLIDATAAARLRHPNPKSQTNYVLYTEDLTAEELAQLLQQLGADDKQAAEKKPGDGVFDALVVHPLTEGDHKILETLLGVDPTPIAPPKDAGPLGVDPRKPVSDQTGAQVAAALGQGKPGADHALLVLPYNPVRPKRDSAEIKRFLDERKPMRAGALQVLLVLRNPGK
jgi:hypothetical protein